MTRSTQFVAALALVLPLVASCGDPVDVVLVEPRLESLEARPFAFRFQGTWGLLVEGLLADGQGHLEPNMRLPLLVSTASGDEETLKLRPRICGAESGSRYLCGQFLFSMQQGRHISELSAYLDQLNGGLSFVGTNGSWSNVWLFEGEAGPAMALVRRWPGVASATYNGLSYPAGGPQPSFHRPVVNVSPISFALPARGDGTVQARPGDVVTITYSIAGEPELTARFTMCEAPLGDVGAPIGGLGDEPSCG
jgi:hypothetical protein